MDPVAAAALQGLRQGDPERSGLSDSVTLNIDDDDRQGRGNDDWSSLNFNPVEDLLTIVEDFNGDGRPEVLMVFTTSTISGNTGWLSGVAMVEDRPGQWREACQFSHGYASYPPGAIRRLATSSMGWRGFRTDDAPYGWRPMADGSGRMECVGLAAEPSPAIRGLRRRAAWLPWRSIDPDAASALHEFRVSSHPIADAMAINHEGARIGVDRTPGRPRNFDPAFDLLYAVHPMGGDRGPLVFLLFDWPMLRREGEPLPGVVMVENRPIEEPRRRWRIACTIADAGDRGAAGGVTLLDARSEGLRNFRTSAGVYDWRAVPDAPDRPECLRVTP
ncbi:hypothetical protein KPL78_01360 [Roseomonas sp. HJA6]|uniref:VCBS repeat-containing protein n=1 Tax=Roseomonas alba TaxID=2846776 RepID=A0ABS7A5L7_9PROT|nr:hypothetical protein [Neoroseomonas alba]MBW6396469.1 hypothetical protein [Neoroseomonas alba]